MCIRDSDQSVRSLSGGNQQKVILARELENDPALLVMAHPTRGLDIGATSFVHEQMIGAREREMCIRDSGYRRAEARKPHDRQGADRVAV